MGNKEKSKVASLVDKAAVVAGAVLISAPAFAADAVEIDYTSAVAGVAVLGGIVGAGALKALPTFAAWGVRKALSMLR